MTNLLDRLSRRPGQATTQPAREQAPVLDASFMTAILDGMDNRPEEVRIGNGAGEYGHYTHVSSLIGMCARQHALAALDDRVIRETVTGGHRVMWAIGRAVEKHIRSQYLSATNKRSAFGRWKCICEACEHVGYHRDVLRCAKCDHGLDQYHEYTLFDHENWIKGNPDLLTVPHGNWIVPVEIKSMNAEEFGALKAPKGDHVFQLSHYHRMLGLEGFKTHTHGVILYCVKEFKYGSPYKEFHVDMRAPAITGLLEESVAVARSLRQARESGLVPARTLCRDHNSSRAKKCPFVVPCFARG